MTLFKQKYEGRPKWHAKSTAYRATNLDRLFTTRTGIL